MEISYKKKVSNCFVRLNKRGGGVYPFENVYNNYMYLNISRRTISKWPVQLLVINILRTGHFYRSLIKGFSNQSKQFRQSSIAHLMDSLAQRHYVFRYNFYHAYPFVSIRSCGQ